MQTFGKYTAECAESAEGFLILFFSAASAALAVKLLRRRICP